MPRPFIPVYWDPTAKRILCDLPLTQPTGRARLRREGRPIAARQVPLQADDMFEWQIAYRDEEGNPVELGEMLRIAVRERLLDAHTLQEITHWVRSQNKFFDEEFFIKTEGTCEQFAGFQVSWRKHPVLIRDVEDGVRVEIEIRHRQRAVGFQAMVFLLIALRRCEPPNLIERRANPKELAQWAPSLETIIGLIRAFSVASRAYREDMIRLLEGR
ncbi:R.Pab1 family restriction endonuclease [Thermoflexus hugenholtzii]